LGNTSIDQSFVARVKGTFGWIRAIYTARIHPPDTLTVDRTYTLPNASGTVALIDPSTGTQTFTGSQIFSSTTRPTSSGSGTPVDTSLITTKDALTYFLTNSYYPITTTFAGTGSGQIVVSGASSTYFGWAGSPVAGTSYAVGQCSNLPNVFTAGVSMAYALGSGTGGVIDMGTNFTFGFSLVTNTTARDNIIRVILGKQSVIASGAVGVPTHGFGVRVNKKTASSTIYEMRLFGSTQSYSNDVITAATNATPIVITSNAHNLQTGDRVEVAGCVGNTAANGIFTVSSVTTNTFTLDGSAGNGTWTSGGAVCRITDAVEFTAGNPQAIFLTNTWSTTGTVELRIGTMSGAALLSLGRLCPIPRHTNNAVVGQTAPLKFGLQSITDATANLAHHIGNFFIMKPYV